MATLVNDGDINWNGSWQTTGLVSTLHASTNLSVDSAQPYYSATFNGVNGRTDIGVIAYIALVELTGGTLTVTLEQNNGGWSTVATATMTYNVTNTNCPSYVFFKFVSSHAETAGTNNYRYKFATTGGTTQECHLRADATTTTVVAVTQVLSATASLADGDIVHVAGYATSATNNPTSATVTYNVETGAATTGDNGKATGGIYIDNGGILSSAVTASKNYYLEIAGNIFIYPGGEMNVGTVASPMPSTSTFTYEFNTTAADRTLRTIAALNAATKGGKLVLQGNQKFATPTNFHTTLDATANSGQKILNCAIDVAAAGWVTGDKIVISGTSSTLAQSEAGTIDSITNDSITLLANLTNTHLSGARVINLTRNIIITQSGSNWGYLDLNSMVGVTPESNIDWVLFDGLNGTAAAESVIRFNTGQGGFLDNVAFDGCTGSTADYGYTFFATDLERVGKSFSNWAIWGDDRLGGGIYITAGSCSFNHIVQIKQTNTYFIVNVAPLEIIKCNTCISIDRNSATTDYSGFGVVDYGQIWELKNCIIGNLKDSGAAGGKAITLSTYGGTRVYAYNCFFGSDGTNDLNNTIDISFGTTNNNSEVFLYNCSLRSVTPIGMPTILFDSEYDSTSVYEQQVNRAVDTSRTTRINGTISDQITGGQTAAWARGGSGLCVYLNPSSSVNPLRWDFYVPVTAATAFQLKAYVKTTQTSSGPTLTCTIYDSSDNATELISAESVTLTSDWALYTSSSCNPTATGFCRVRMSCVDGASTGDVGIDDVSVR